MKLQPYKVAATERSISKYRKNKLQVLPKTNTTYKWSEVQTWILHHRVCHKLRNGLLGKLFLLLYFITTKKVEIYSFAVDIAGRSVRNQQRLFVPRVRTNYGKWSLAWRGTAIWNRLPPAFYGAKSVTIFKKLYCML